jgi:hypothetical protein
MAQNRKLKEKRKIQSKTSYMITRDLMELQVLQVSKDKLQKK